MKKLLSMLMMTTIVGNVVPTTVISCQAKSDYYTTDWKDRDFDDKSNLPLNTYVPNAISDDDNNGNLNAWANDPCAILYNPVDHLYYSWELFRNGRDFQSNWVEMTSPDLKTWTQTTERIKLGREFFATKIKNPAAIGGSVWIDKEGKFFDKGDVVFLISMQISKIMGGDQITGDSGIAYFVSHGLGKDIYKAGALSSKNLNRGVGSKDWRDTNIFEMNNGLYFAIAAHNRIEFWKINSFVNEEQDIEKVSELFVRPNGVEVPNVVRIADNEYYISCSIQDAPMGGPFQSTYYWFARWVQDENKNTGRFVIDSNGQHEYGTEGYAQRINDPFQDDIAQHLVTRSMPANWNYNTDIWSWKGGAYTTDQVIIDLNNKVAKVEPLQDTEENGQKVWGQIQEQNYYEGARTAIYHLKGRDFRDNYSLKFNYGTFDFQLKNVDSSDIPPSGGLPLQTLNWKNNLPLPFKKWTTNGGVTDFDDDVDLVWNQTSLTVYNKTKGWTAHFMLFQNIKHYANSNAKSWTE